MAEHGSQIDGLHIDLQTLDELIAAYETAKIQITDVINKVARDAVVPDWTADEISKGMAARFNDATFDGQYCSHQGLLGFEAAFQSVVLTLMKMREEYVRTEGDIAAALRAIEGQPLYDLGYRPGEPR